MTTILDNWGNSLGVRLPKGVAETVGLHAGDRVHVEVEKGTVIIRPARPRYTLDELLEGIAPEMVHAEFDYGAEVGAERL